MAIASDVARRWSASGRRRRQVAAVELMRSWVGGSGQQQSLSTVRAKCSTECARQKLCDGEAGSVASGRAWKSACNYKTLYIIINIQTNEAILIRVLQVGGEEEGRRFCGRRLGFAGFPGGKIDSARGRMTRMVRHPDLCPIGSDNFYHLMPNQIKKKSRLQLFQASRDAIADQRSFFLPS